MRVVALVASLVAVSGCTLLFGLDGLRGGEPSQGDAASDDSMRPGDANQTKDAGRDTGGDANPACTPPPSPALDDCTGIVRLPAPPVIDGVLDCGVPLWRMPLQGWSGPGTIPPTVLANLAVAWRPDGLYFFVSVTGLGPMRYPPPAGTWPWCGDGVELYVDDDGQYSNPPLYDNPGTIQLIAEAPSNMITSTSTGVRYRDGMEVAPWTGGFTVVRTGDGFDAEAFVVASDLDLSTWTLAANGAVGMDVAVDIGDPANQTATCPRLGQFSIQLPVTDASCPKAACNVNEFCTPQLEP
jgi:hypothetical protein